MSSEVAADAGRASTFSVGRLRCTVLSDRADPSEPEFVFGDAPPEAYRPLLEGRLDAGVHLLGYAL